MAQTIPGSDSTATPFTERSGHAAKRLRYLALATVATIGCGGTTTPPAPTAPAPPSSDVPTGPAILELDVCDEQHLAVTASQDRHLRVWDTESGSLVVSGPEHQRRIDNARFSPDCRTVFTETRSDLEGRDTVGVLWDIVENRVTAEMPGHSGLILDARFSRDGRLLATASGDDTVKVWNAMTGNLVRTLEGHRGGVGSVRFTQDGLRLVSASSDWTARVWDISTGAVVTALPRGAQVFSGHLLVLEPYALTTVSNVGAFVWDLNTGEPRWFLNHDITGVAHNPNNNFVIAGGRDGVAKLFELRDATLQTGQGPTPRAHLRWSGEEHRAAITTVAFSPDGQRILTAGADATARVWDTETGSVVTVFNGHTRAISGAAFVSSGRQVVTASYDGSLRVWDASSGDVVRILVP